jgi:Protein of unknown function (DUF4238)
MSAPKQHHYVHEKYQVNFCSPEKTLHVFDKWGQGRYFSSTPAKLLKESYYYSQPVHADSSFDSKLETFFSQIETDWPRLVDAISNRQALPDELYSSFIQILCMLRSRVPSTRKAIELCLQETSRGLHGGYDEPIPETIANLFSSQNDRIKELQAKGTLRFHHLLDEKLIRISIDPHRSIVMMPQIVDSMRPIVGRLFQKSFLHNRTETKFLSSDNPVVFFCRSKDSEITPYKVDGDGDFELIFPITKDVVFYHNTKEKVGTIHRNIWSKKTAEKINRIIAQFADRFVIGSNQEVATVAKEFIDNCPTPDLAKSLVVPEGIVRLDYIFGKPSKLPSWQYDFEKQGKD